MKPLAVILAAASLVLAASSAYLWKTLQTERARNLQVSMSAASHAPDRSDADLDAAVPERTAVVPGPQPPETAPPAASVPDSGPAGAARQQRLEQLQDPHARTARVAAFKDTLRPGMADMVAYIDLDPQESEQLLHFMAESSVHMQQLVLECQSTPGCDARALQQKEGESLMREVERMLGPYKLQRMKAYEEISRVRSFRSQLPVDHGMSDAAITELGEALAEERRRPAVSNESDSAFNQRIYDRAARFLNAEQLESFRRVQVGLFGRGVENWAVQ